MRADDGGCEQQRVMVMGEKGPNSKWYEMCLTFGNVLQYYFKVIF
jgi:hypothetical protein